MLSLPAIDLMTCEGIVDNAVHMCRSIRPLYNFEPPVTEAEVHAASLQFVRKISGYAKPSRANEAAFYAAVEAITAISTDLLDSLKTDAPPRKREALVKPARQSAP